MHYFLITYLLFLSLSIMFVNIKLDKDPLKNLKDGESLVVNFSSSESEFHSINEGIIMIRKGELIQAKYVRYLESTYGKQHIEQEFITFYKENRSKYRVRYEWTLNSDQIDLLSEFLVKLMNFDPNHGFSNAPESYVVMGKDYELVVFDLTKQLRKYRIKLKQGLGMM